jgi:hypothetical protein
MSAAVEGTGKETFYTRHGVRLGKIVAFNPRDSKWYLRAMKVQAGTTRAVGEEGRANRQREEGAVGGEQRGGTTTPT